MKNDITQAIKTAMKARDKVALKLAGFGDITIKISRSTPASPRGRGGARRDPYAGQAAQ